MKIPVIINNRDLLTWPKAMIERIKTYEGVGSIHIIDNGSTYEPLTDWYNNQKTVDVRKFGNLGHGGPWVSGLVEELRSEYYVVTDSDLGLEDTPDNTLIVLLEKLQKQPDLRKVGLGLNWEAVSSKSPYYERLNLYEKDRWKNSEVIDDVYVGVNIDTTFAMYNVNHYFIGGGSLTHPYTARHYPWELSVEEAKQTPDFKYYIDNASYSCSYKTIVSLL